MLSQKRCSHRENAAFDRSIIAYDENSNAEERQRCREETETLAILTGLEIDSAKSGVKPDIDEYLNRKTVSRSKFLKYKVLLDDDGSTAWYEQTSAQKRKDFFENTDWDSVTSNVERLPYLAYMLKKHTPKLKQKKIHHLPLSKRTEVQRYTSAR